MPDPDTLPTLPPGTPKPPRVVIAETPNGIEWLIAEEPHASGYEWRSPAGYYFDAEDPVADGFRPLAEVDLLPQTRETVEALADICWGNRALFFRDAWDKLTALRAHLSTPPTPAEPTDPGARVTVTEANGDVTEWARNRIGVWVCIFGARRGGNARTWADLCALGTVEVTS